MAKLYSTFSSLQDAVVAARLAAKESAKKECGQGVLRSRGAWMITLDAVGNLIEPLCENYYSGAPPTAAGLDRVIRSLAEFPAVMRIEIVGGWNHAAQLTDFADGNYDPWVSEWSVLAWDRRLNEPLDEIVRRHSGFQSLEELVEGTHASYRPSLNTHAENEKECFELMALADAYDAAQSARGDSRRAYRY